MVDIKIIGANFLELKSKRNPDFSGKVELKTNIKINSLKKIEKTKDKLRMNYNFEIDYGDLGGVKIKGELFLLSDKKIIEKIIKNNENKEYNTSEYIELTNILIKKASIKAFELEDELNLPIHIKLPTISFKK